MSLSIRFFKKGCTNRHFYHIVVTPTKRRVKEPYLEQIGSFDPMTNERNEKLIALNVQRFQYWLGKGVTISKPVSELLGLAGILPVHPASYLRAYKARKSKKEKEENVTTEKQE